MGCFRLKKIAIKTKPGPRVHFFLIHFSNLWSWLKCGEVTQTIFYLHRQQNVKSKTHANTFRFRRHDGLSKVFFLYAHPQNSSSRPSRFAQNTIPSQMFRQLCIIYTPVSVYVYIYYISIHKH